MKTTVAELTRRAASLPSDFAAHVIYRHGNLAKVKSFSSDTVWDVSIMRGTEDGERRVTCTCPATKVCHHIIAFFAAAKGLAPTQDTPKMDKGKESPSESIRHTDGMKMIASAVAMLVDGIALVVRENKEE